MGDLLPDRPLQHAAPAAGAASWEPPADASSTAPADARAQGGEYNVRVAVRVRPLLPREASERCRECVGVDNEDSSVMIGKTRFAFDHVFGTEASQERVHEDTARPLLESLGSGLNAALLAYGQTSSGKTYTLGSSSSAVPEEQQGVIPRFVSALFRDIVYPRLSEAEITIKVSFVELHNEDINDLLEPNFLDKPRTISIRDDPQQGVVVGGVQQLDVKRPSELLRCLDKGAVIRTTASTNMNEQSSRSHAIFTVTLEQQSRSTGETLLSKVRFADLAGSERAKKTGTVGERFREGVNINQGLLALGNVISALGDPKLNRSHVPYRDSKLTRLLQDSLGGNSRTLLIACVSPADVHFGETLTTLKYANRAKNIKNKVTVNLSVTSSDVAKLQEQIQEMHLELARTRQLQVLGPEGPTVQDLLAQRKENARLREELEAAKQGLRAAAEEALQYRAKYEHCVAASGAKAPPDGCPGACAWEADATQQAMLKHTREAKVGLKTADKGMRRLQDILLGAQELREQNSALHRPKRGPAVAWEQEEVEEEAEPGSEPPAGLDMAEGGSLEDIDVSILDRTGGPGMDISLLPPETLEGNEEALAHVAEDQREEEQYRSAQSEMQTAVQELDDVIKEKEALMEQLTKQSKVFRSMQARYEMRLNELRLAVGAATEEKEKMLKEMQQLMSTKQRTPQDEGEVAKRKAHLQGRLHEVNRQLVDLQRRQGEAQRLLRLKEQQEAQIRRMQEEIDRLKGQKLVVLSRMKCEEQQHRLWRRRCDARLRELVRKGAELQRLHRQQGKLLGKKTKEAEQSARKVEDLKREQRQLLEASRRRSLVQRESARTRKLREVNERLQRELQEREWKVSQMEATLARRAKLQEELSPEAAGELNEVEDNIEMLDAQIDFAAECIAQSQTDILRLTTAPRPPEEAEGGAPAGGGGVLEDGKDEAGRSGAEVVARLTSLEDAKATCLACFQSLDEAQGEVARLQARTTELEAELTQRAAQVEELQARQRIAESQWAEQANELQRLHLSKEVYLLSQVDRDLAEQHGLAAAPPPTQAEEEAPEPPAESSLQRLLQCRTELLELAEQQAEQLQQRLAEAERARDEAELAAVVARRGAGPSAEPGRQAEESSATPPGQAAMESSSGVGDAPCEAWAEEGLVEDEGLQVLEGVAKRTGERLGALWRDLGVDDSFQRQRLGTLAEASAQLYSDELRAYEDRLARLRREHEGIQRMARAKNLVLPPELSSGGGAAEAPLHERHAALERALAVHLEASITQLRRDLTVLFGLPADASELSREQLAALAGGGARCLAGKESSAASLQPRDLDVLGLAGPGAGEWLRRPALETFAALEERQRQAVSLLSELRTQLQSVDEELLRHYEALAVPEQQYRAFLARRGKGLPALAVSQQELQQLQHSVRMSIAHGRVRLVEKWMELGTPAAAQDRVLQALKESKGQLEELKTLNAEMQRLEVKIRHRQLILDHMKSLAGLEDQIQEFEREASNSARLRGSSVKLLQEEQQRLRFRKRKAKVVEELIGHVAQWELAHGERFMHSGAPLRDSLQQDLDDCRELGGLTLAMDLSSARKSSSGVRGCDGNATPTSGAAVAAVAAAAGATSPSMGPGGPPLSARRATTDRRAPPRRAVTGPVGRSLGADAFGVGCTGDLGGAVP